MTTAAPIARIAEYAARERFERLRPEVLHHVKRALLDWFAAGIAGYREERVAILERSLDENLGRGDARLLSGYRASVRTAAMINGTAAHILVSRYAQNSPLFRPIRG